MSKRKIALLIKLATPLIAVAAGSIASWLLVHVRVLSTFGYGHDQIAKAIVTAVILVLTTVLTYVSAHTQLFEALDRWVLIAEKAEDNQPLSASQVNDAQTAQGVLYKSQQSS